MTTLNTQRIGDVVGHARRELQAAGIENAAAEARRLVASAADLAGEALIREPEHELSRAQHERIRDWLERRAAGEPLARIRGEKEFYGRPFRLSSDTLEPRADSENARRCPCLSSSISDTGARILGASSMSVPGADA